MKVQPKEPVVKVSPASQEECAAWVKKNKPLIAELFIEGSFAKGALNGTLGCFVRCPTCDDEVWRWRGDWHTFKGCPEHKGGSAKGMGFLSEGKAPIKNLSPELVAKIQALIDAEKAEKKPEAEPPTV